MASCGFLLVGLCHVVLEEACVGDVVDSEAPGEKFVSLGEMCDDIIIPNEE